LWKKWGERSIGLKKIKGGRSHARVCRRMQQKDPRSTGGKRREENYVTFLKHTFGNEG